MGKCVQRREDDRQYAQRHPPRRRLDYKLSLKTDFGSRHGRREVQPGGIPQYFEDLNRAPNTEIGPQKFFEIASIDRGQ
jgi:hypothetical protein